MGVLDDLQAEIDSKRAAEQLQTEEKQAQQAYYEQHLRPPMARAYQYLAQLVEKLNTVQPDVRPSYPFDPQGGELRLRQADYKFRVDDGENPRQVDVICSCSLPRPLEFHLPTADRAERYGRELDEHRMVYHRKDFRDKYQNLRSATFIVEGPLRAHIRLSASAAERCVFVDLRNIEARATKRYRFEPEQLDAALLDRLARMLLRQESCLVTKEVADDTRRQLQQTLERERRKEAEQAQQLERDREKRERRGPLSRLFRRS